MEGTKAYRKRVLINIMVCVDRSSSSNNKQIKIAQPKVFKEKIQKKNNINKKKQNKMEIKLFKVKKLIELTQLMVFLDLKYSNYFIYFDL